ncbi:MAG TPA: FG-GAP-like repeat-containing protein, partial [Minicystis sp.]|nr:FG-GAP-like repeat-containing protein [Minicystis sp.]
IGSDSGAGASNTGGAAAGGGGGQGGATGTGGAPSCATNETACGGACVDLAHDPAHCGACDRACGAGQACSFGACEVPCTKTLGFPNDPLPATGSRPEDVALVDLDGDGKLDVVTLDGGAGAVRARLGRGNGRFGPAIDTTAWPSPMQSGAFDRFAFDDVDGDGKLDAVLTHAAGDEILVLLGHGDGTFAAPIATSVPGPTAVVLGDLDGDGHVDAVVVGYHSGRFAVMRGLGDGTFAAPVLRPSGTAASPADNLPSDLALGDLDGDGWLDLVISNGSGELTARLNRNDGTFAAPIVFDLGAAGRGLRLGDVDGDGALDAVVPTAASSQQMRVLRGGGDGTFSGWDWDDFAASQRPAIADVDGDGLLDVVVANAEYEIFAVSRGVGAGMFDVVGTYASRGMASAIAVGDLDGDGYPDVVTSAVDSDVVGVSLNRGDGTFTEPFVAAGGVYASALTAGDVDGDGKLDLCITRVDVPPGSSPRFDVYLGQGDGSFGAPLPTDLQESLVFQTAIADVDGDGRADLVSLGATMAGRALLVRRGAGDGTFDAPIETDVAVGGATRMIVADVDGDGRSDVVVFADANAQLFLGAHDGTFGPAMALQTVDVPATGVAGDWDGDGALDFAFVTSPGSIVAVRGHGDGSFHLTSKMDVPALVHADAATIAAGDMNNDGIPDLVVMTLSPIQHTRLMVFLGHGDGTFALPIGAEGRISQSPITLADLDGDGNLDVLFDGAAEASIDVMRGAGDGTLLPPATYPAPAYTWGVVVGDVNGDGSRDLVAVGNAGEPVTLANHCLSH